MSETHEIHFTKLAGREIFLNTDVGNNEMLEICTYSPAGPGKGVGPQNQATDYLKKKIDKNLCSVLCDANTHADSLSNSGLLQS